METIYLALISDFARTLLGVFAQIICSCFIGCLTGFRLNNANN
jgi:hypothetical protein